MCFLLEVKCKLTQLNKKHAYYYSYRKAAEIYQLNWSEKEKINLNGYANLLHSCASKNPWEKNPSSFLKNLGQNISIIKMYSESYLQISGKEREVGKTHTNSLYR